MLSQVHASFCAILIGSMDGWWVIVGCGWWIFVGYECWIMIVVYAYHVCLCSLLIVGIWNWYWFFLYWTHPCNFVLCGWYLWWSRTLFVGAEWQWQGAESKILVRSRRADVMTLALFLERVVFCNQLLRSWFLSFLLLS